MDGKSAEEAEQRFSLIVGGPFTRLLARCRLLGADQLPTHRGALLLAAAAWLLPALAALAQELTDRGHFRALAYFFDVSTFARLFVAVGIMLSTERHADRRLSALVREFWVERIVVGEARERFFALLRAADRQTSSALAQFVLLVVAWIGGGQAMEVVMGIENRGWEGAVLDGGPVLSWAGLVARHVSVPLFQFLILLWLWRFAVWSVLLLRISRLPLELTPLHADRCAGLGFLGMFPGVFRGFVFGLSCVVASLLFKDLQATHVANELELVRDVALLWVGVVLVLFLGPLFAFYPPLYALREHELTANARVVNRWYRDFHRRWLGGQGESAAEDAAQENAPSLGDLNNAFEILRDMRAVPIDIAVVKQLLLAALLPLALVGASRVPLSDLLGQIAGFVL